MFDFDFVLLLCHIFAPLQHWMWWWSSKKKRKEPCKQYTCLIQRCLEVNSYESARCTDAIDALRRCCEGVRFNSTHCSYLPGPAYSNTVKTQHHAAGDPMQPAKHDA